MKAIGIIGITAVCVLLMGCNKNNSSQNNNPTSQTNTAPAIVLTNQEVQQPPSDEELRQKVTGVWEYSSTNKVFGIISENTFTLAPNGNYAKQTIEVHKTERNNFLGLGTWQIKDGILITTITKANPIPQGAVGDDLKKGLANGGFVNQHKIISVNNDELICEIDVYTITANGGHNKTKGTMTWTRKK
ncbi:MAG TPA: hypothetical protein VHG89_06320 [Verrucomicrobiae bacterium]|nr:hypothetical protein [Verrucomicrobiae bacterium]